MQDIIQDIQGNGIYLKVETNLEAKIKTNGGLHILLVIQKIIMVFKIPSLCF